VCDLHELDLARWWAKRSQTSEVVVGGYSRAMGPPLHANAPLFCSDASIFGPVWIL
jgi:hypothetical protein